MNPYNAPLLTTGSRGGCRIVFTDVSVDDILSLWLFCQHYISKGIRKLQANVDLRTFAIDFQSRILAVEFLEAWRASRTSDSVRDGV